MKSRGCFKTHNPHQKSDGFSSHHQHPNYDAFIRIILVVRIVCMANLLRKLDSTL